MSLNIQNLCLGALLIACLPVGAQVQSNRNAAPAAPRNYLNDLLGRPSWLDLHIDYRLRYETQDVRYRVGEIGGDQQLAQRSRLRLALKREADPFGLLIELEDARAMLTDSGSTVTPIHRRELGALQLYGRFLSKALAGKKVRSELDFGRVTMDLGKRRLVARNVYRNTTNRFDGLLWHLGADRRWLLRSFVLQPVSYAAPNFNRGRREGYLWGAYFEDQRSAWMRKDFYYLHLYEDPQKVLPRARNLRTFGMRLYRTPTGPGWIYELESAWQFGKYGSQDHFGHLQVAELGHRFNHRWAPMALFQYEYASGDRDPTDNRNQRFDTLFGARRFELIPTGILNLLYRSNLNAPGYRITARPAKPLEVLWIHRLYWLAQSRDQWVGSGRRDPTGQSGAALGQFLEGVVRWRAHPNVLYEAGYVRFRPGEFVRRQVPVTGRLPSNYFYLATEMSF